MTNTDQRLKEIEERLEAATLRPWTIMVGIPTNVLDYTGLRVARCDFDGDMNHLNAHKNAEFIAAAPTDVEYLLGLVKRYQTALEKIADPRKRDHQEPDKYTECGCIMNMAEEALSKEDGE